MTSKIESSRGSELVALNTAFCVLAVCTVVLRCYVRMTLIKAFGADDWMMIMATAFQIACCVMSDSGIHYGFGQHTANLEKENIELALMYWWLCVLFYSLTMVATKLSFALFLLRFTVTRTHSCIVYGATLFTVVPGSATLFVQLFQCRPISFYWDKNQLGRCLDMGIITALAYLYGTFSVLTDFTFVILPGFLLWNLPLKRRAKIAAIILMGMGCMLASRNNSFSYTIVVLTCHSASSAVAVRFAYLMKLKDPDFLWATVDIAIWSTVEMGLAITAASVATLRPLMRLISSRLGILSPQTTPNQVTTAKAL